MNTNNRKVGRMALACLISLSSYVVNSAEGINCGDVITENTILTEDLLNCNDGLIIGDENITLDGGGHVIDGNCENISSCAAAGDGIRIWGYKGVTIKNIIIKEFGEGVSLYQTQDNTIVNNAFISNNRGVRLASSLQNTIEDNQFSNNFLAVRVLFSSHENLMIHNSINGTIANAISIGDSIGNVVERNYLSGNGHGIGLAKSSESVIYKNTVIETNGNAFSLWEASDNSILANTAKYNTNGFHSGQMSKNNEFSKNKSFHSSQYAMWDESDGGTGTAGTDNIYIKNICKSDVESEPAGLCK